MPLEYLEALESRRFEQLGLRGMGDLLLENDDERLLSACRCRIGVSGGDSIVVQLPGTPGSHWMNILSTQNHRRCPDDVSL